MWIIKKIIFSFFTFMDTAELSNEAYTAVLVEAERFHHNLTIHFGVLADDCDEDIPNKVIQRLGITVDLELKEYNNKEETPLLQMHFSGMDILKLEEEAFF